MAKNKIIKIGFILSIFAILSIIGCKNDEITQNLPPPEILTLSEDCLESIDLSEQCCRNDCTKYCTENNNKYHKHILNDKSCACWCS
ncbi:MAG: hypothetical protein ACOC3X_01305 [Nanoarchaeota archaeon]